MIVVFTEILDGREASTNWFGSISASIWSSTTPSTLPIASSYRPLRKGKSLLLLYQS